MWPLLALLGVFLALQLVRPELTSSPAKAEVVASPEVRRILDQHCYSCHSSERRLAWFDEIVPAYWLVVDDVKKARRHVSFSELGAEPAAKQKAVLFEAVNQIQMGAMPLPRYVRLHPGAAVSRNELAVLRAFLTPPLGLSAAAPAVTAAADEQYARWIASGSEPAAVLPAPNGIALPSAYRTWKMVSSTERFDNQSLRMVLGNDVAHEAIASGRTAHWPDGTTFAKVAWDREADGEGGVQAGALVQVELMIKDRTKYASTLGWGFARWRGLDLKPYGTSPDFTSECVGCHAPLRSSDYLFTAPVAAVVAADSAPRAAPTAGPPADLVRWNIVTSTVDERDATMATLFGNEVAVHEARPLPRRVYPRGSVLGLVTWSQEEDPRWFGAKIPAAMKAVELVTVTTTPEHQPAYAYAKYEGSPLERAPQPDAATVKSRTEYLLARRPVVMP